MCLIEPLSFQHITDIKNDILYSFIKNEFINPFINLLLAALGLCCCTWALSRCSEWELSLLP